jgi:hypothetical protein
MEIKTMVKELTKEILRNSEWKVTTEQSKILQEKAFELGFSWADGSKEYFEHRGNLIISERDNITFGFYTDTTKRRFEDYFDEDYVDNYKGTFMWAIEQMEQGKKVKKKSWADNSRFIKMEYQDVAQGDDERCILDSKYQFFDIELRDIGATDWELYEEKESLSDKRAGTHLHDYFLEDGEHGGNPRVMTHFYHEEDVIKLVQDLKNVIGKYVISPIHEEEVRQDISKLFGDKLL